MKVGVKAGNAAAFPGAISAGLAARNPALDEGRASKALWRQAASPATNAPHLQKDAQQPGNSRDPRQTHARRFCVLLRPSTLPGCDPVARLNQNGKGRRARTLQTLL